MQMHFDLDYVGHSATFSFPLDGTHMHSAAVSPPETQGDTVVLCYSLKFFTSAAIFPVASYLDVPKQLKLASKGLLLQVWRM